MSDCSRPTNDTFIPSCRLPRLRKPCLGIDVGLLAYPLIDDNVDNFTEWQAS